MSFRPEQLRLLYYPDPRLRQVAEPVSGVTEEIRALIPRMFEIMEQTRGIGLAGPQIGYPHRIVVASVVYEEGEDPKEEVYLNPRLVGHQGKIREEEGCLSFPGLYTPIDRYEEVTAEYEDLTGGTFRVEARGLHARLFQHEIDHLDGVLIIDRASKKRVKAVKEQLENIKTNSEQ